MSKKILVTGGAGFIGSNLVHHFVKKYPNYQIYNLDSLTYAGNLENLKEVENASNYHFLKEDINDEKAINSLFEKYQFTDVIHLAAESHVDRSITDPSAFLRTNIFGTFNLLNAARKCWGDEKNHLFYHVSTDEVYGSLGETGYFLETTPYDPRSPYSASKASSDHIVRAFYHTYGLPIVISNCSNNYGPYQFPEKLIPLMINNIQNQKELPVYGDGKNIRDWLWVGDHVEAIDVAFHKGKVGETYNIGGHNEKQNIELVTIICDLMDEALGNEPKFSRELITYVKDRAGHDKRYAIDPTKIKEELGWEPKVYFEEGIRKTIEWYLSHKKWMKNVTSGDYMEYYKNHYSSN